MVRARLLISGRVQGVFYRATCWREGMARGLDGWVRNLSDGRVEALLQGPRDKVEDLIKWCYRGPSHAQVSGIEVTYEESGEDLAGFQIR